MSTKNLEDELRNLKFIHLTENELAAYCDQEPNPIRRARVEAHVKECFRCERELALLLEERAALSHQRIPAEELFERAIEGTESLPTSPGGRPEIATGLTVRARLAEYLRGMVTNWQLEFAVVRRGAKRAGDHGEEVWGWQSEDGKLEARATMDENANLTIRFSSSEMEMEGSRLQFRLGSFYQETTLLRDSESEVSAQVAVPRQFRGGSMADISIEII